jgi:hypothetical protein
VQVDPIKPMLKPPDTKRLKLKNAELLSTSAFKFNLRRYIEAHARRYLAPEDVFAAGPHTSHSSPFSPQLEPHSSRPLTRVVP